MKVSVSSRVTWSESLSKWYMSIRMSQLKIPWLPCAILTIISKSTYFTNTGSRSSYHYNKWESICLENDLYIETGPSIIFMYHWRRWRLPMRHWWRDSHGRLSRIYLDPLLITWFNFNPSMDKYHTPSKAWDGITYPFLNFNGCTVEV